MNHQFLHFLTRLDGREVRQLKAYMEPVSPKTQLRRLFDFVIKHYPAFRFPEKLKAAYLEKKLFGADAPASKQAQPAEREDARVQNLYSDLFLHLRDCFAEKMLHEMPLLRQWLWGRFLYKKGWTEDWFEAVNDLPGILNKNRRYGAVFHWWQVAVIREKFQTESLKKHHDPEIMDQYEQSIDTFYYLEKLKLFCKKAALSLQIKDRASLEPMLQWFEGIPKTTFEASPALLLYAAAFRLITQPSMRNYQEMETLFRQYVRDIELEDLNTLRDYLMNYGSAQVRQENNRFFEISHQLNRFCEQEGVFEGNSNVIVPIDFINVVRIAAQAGDMAWAGNFIDTYIDRVHAEGREETRRLAQAIILMEQGNYQAALEVVPNYLEFREPRHIVHGFSILIQCWYLLKKDQGELDRHIKYLEQFLYRKHGPATQLSEGTKQASLAFTRVIKMMAGGKKNKAALKAALAGETHTILRKWLAEQIEKLD